MKLKTMLALAATTIGVGAFAASPVAVWDGDFSVEQTGYTLNINDNTLSQDNSTITIVNDYLGVDVNFASNMKDTGVTLLVKYANFVKGDNAKAVATQCNDPEYTMVRTGIDLQAENDLWGMWYHNGWADNGNRSAAGVFPANGTFAFTYKGDGGTYLYASSDPFNIPSAAVWGNSSLRAGADPLWGVTVGGMRSGNVNQNWRAAQGATISGIAIFAGVLDMDEVNAYRWPTDEEIEFSANTSVSAINTRIAALDADTSRVFVNIASGVTIDIDAEFASTYPIKIISDGNVTLSAETQPAASYFSSVDFSGVKGALLRSWLPEPGVAGINFRSASGNDVSGALATCTNWIQDSNSASGSSAALFSDGLTKITWTSANTWSSGEGSMLSGYIDDGNKNYNNDGARVSISNVPYDTYDVIIYCNSDQGSGGSFYEKTVNDKTYTWDSSTGSVVEGVGNWGRTSLSIPVYGVNAMRIKNLTGPLSIYGGQRFTRDGAIRGCIAAVQIMPPETPDNIRVYTLTLDGTETTWSDGNWTLDNSPVEAPTSGYVQIVATASTALTVNQQVSLADLKVSGGEGVVVTVSNGENASLYAIKATIESGVFQQGTEAVLGATPMIDVEDGATFDLNALAVNGSNTFTIEGDGDGDADWPWALTSSSGECPANTLTAITLAGNATIGGANKINFGKADVACYLDLAGHTLTKTGTGELAFTNGRCKSGATGTFDIAEGIVSLNQYCNLDGSKPDGQYAATTVILRDGAELKNETDRAIVIDALQWQGGTITGAQPFAIASSFDGEGELASLWLIKNAVVSLTGKLTVGDLTLQTISGVDDPATPTITTAVGVAEAAFEVAGTYAGNAGEIDIGPHVMPVFSGLNNYDATVVYSEKPDYFGEFSGLNWYGTVVINYPIAGTSTGSPLELSAYGNDHSTVCFAQPVEDVYLTKYEDDGNPGNVGVNIYLKANMSLRNGWAGDDQKTTIPRLGADEGVTFSTRQGGGGVTYFEIAELKDFAGTIAVSDGTDVTVANVVMDELPEVGALVVKATAGTGANKGTISGSVTVGEETVSLVFDTKDGVSGLYVAEPAPETVPVDYGDSKFTLPAYLTGEIATAAGVAEGSDDFAKAAIAYVVGGEYENGEVVLPTPTITVDGTTVTVVFASDEAMDDVYDIACNLQYATQIAAQMSWTAVESASASGTMSDGEATLSETVQDGTAARFYRVVVTVGDK